MRGRFFNELQSYEKTVEQAKSFQFVVYVKNPEDADTKHHGITSSAMPIDVLEDALEDLRLIDEGHSLPIWNRRTGRLTVIPIREIRNVEIVFADAARNIVTADD